ncbi:hypothetical protein M0802_003005 [Mischocyttarus mexicanus]|nr:hypothetical protein M0802_003005 [Mischocyttarus mexicanus]
MRTEADMKESLASFYWIARAFPSSEGKKKKKRNSFSLKLDFFERLDNHHHHHHHHQQQQQHVLRSYSRRLT